MNMPLAVGGVFFIFALTLAGAFFLGSRAVINHVEDGPRWLSALWAFLTIAIFGVGIGVGTWWGNTWGTEDRPCAEYSHTLIKGVRYQTCERYWEEAPQ